MSTENNAMNTANTKPSSKPDADTQKKRVGQNLYAYMSIRGMTQQELADKVGISRTALSSYITARRYPRPAIIEKLATCLGVSVGELTDNYREENDAREPLSDEAYNVGRMFDTLDSRGRKIVRAVLEAEVKSVRDTRTDEAEKWKTLG